MNRCHDYTRLPSEADQLNENKTKYKQSKIRHKQLWNFTTFIRWLLEVSFRNAWHHRNQKIEMCEINAVLNIFKFSAKAGKSRFILYIRFSIFMKNLFLRSLEDLQCVKNFSITLVTRSLISCKKVMWIIK